MLICLLAIALFLAGCDETTTPENQNPGTPEVSPTDFTIMPGDSISLTAQASDPDGGTVTYAWTFSGGTPLTAEGASVTWTAPSSNATIAVMVMANDGQGGTSSGTGTITVHPNAAYQYDTPFEDTLEPQMDQLSENGLAPTPGTCHFWASAAVVWTNGAVIVFTGLPTLAFLEAVTHRPIWYPPDTWLWAYTVPWGASLVTVELYGTLDGATEIDWEMLISGTLQEYNRFKWVSGTSQTDATAGHWILYDHRTPSSETEALRVDWTRLAQDDRDLLYQNILTTSEGYGDSLRFTIDGDSATVRLDDLSEGTFTRVAWNVEDGSGTLTGANGDRCCWGPAPTYDDINCE